MELQGLRLSNLHKYLILIVGLVFFIGPLLWLLSTMLKTPGESLVFPPAWIPDPITFDAFRRLFTNLPMFPRWIFNSFCISVSAVIGTVLSASLVAFGFARTKAKSRHFLFIVLLATLMIPYQITLIPLYILYNNIGWYNTWLPLIVPYFFAGPFYVFLFRQFIMTIPRDVDEATYMDGGNAWTVYSRIIFPMSVPVLITGSIFAFVFSWVDFLTPFIFLQSESKYTLSVGLQLLIGTQSQDYPALAAGSFISILPIALLYFFAQRYFMEGVVLTKTRS